MERPNGDSRMKSVNRLGGGAWFRHLILAVKKLMGPPLHRAHTAVCIFRPERVAASHHLHRSDRRVLLLLPIPSLTEKICLLALGEEGRVRRSKPRRELQAL